MGLAIPASPFRIPVAVLAFPLQIGTFEGAKKGLWGKRRKPRLNVLWAPSTRFGALMRIAFAVDSYFQHAEQASAAAHPHGMLDV